MDENIAPERTALPAAQATAILINRQSGTVRSMGEDAVRVLVAKAWEGEEPPELFLIDSSEVDATVRRLTGEHRITRLIVGGGDGTITSVAGLLAGHGIAMGIMPLGTMNLLANALGISADPAEALRQMHGAVTRRIDAARAGDELFLHHVSIGIQPRMVKIREKLGYSSRLTKMLAGLRAMAVVLLNPQSQRLRLTLDGRVLEVKAPAVLISNNVYENSAWLKQGALDEGVLGIYMVKPMSSLAYLRLALDLLRGRWRDNLNVREDRARSVTIERHRRFGRRAKSIRATLDGELRLLPLPLTITSDPAALEVLVPAPAGALEGISEGTGGR